MLVRPLGSSSPSALLTELVLEKWRSFHMLTNGRSQIDTNIIIIINNNLILILRAFNEMIKRALHDFYL